MAYCKVPNGEIYYEWVGAAGQKVPTGRPVLVFVHGWGGSLRYWQATARALADTYDCLLYDLRGFGRSTNTQTTVTLADCVADLAALLADLAIDRCSVMAHSMGSSIAVLFLQAFGARVDRAVLACGGVFEYDAVAFGIFRQFGKLVVQVRPRWLTQVPGMDGLVMRRFLHRELPPPDRQEFLEDYLMAEDRAALGTMFDAVSEQSAIALPQAYQSLQMPTLMISGQFDRIIPPPLGEAAARLNAAIEFTVIPDVGHFPMLEDPAEFVERVRYFLDGIH
jgi:pimeloyl-ACP methyl ester carboxylesterase